MGTISLLHDGLANTATLFIGFLGVWALILRFRATPLNSSWYGAAVIAEVVLVVQVVLGALLYFNGLGVVLPRPFMHILYGIVAVVTLPAAYGYFGNLPDERVKTLAMALACIFLWGIILRASSVAEFLPAALQ